MTRMEDKGPAVGYWGPEKPQPEYYQWSCTVGTGGIIYDVRWSSHVEIRSRHDQFRQRSAYLWGP